MTKDLKYWKNNAEEDYMKVPISVLRYVAELEAEVESLQSQLADKKESARIWANKAMEAGNKKNELNLKLAKAEEDKKELLEVLIKAEENWKGNKLIGGTYERIVELINKHEKIQQ
jgi:hypothetical protein